MKEEHAQDTELLASFATFHLFILNTSNIKAKQRRSKETLSNMFTFHVFIDVLIKCICNHHYGLMFLSLSVINHHLPVLKILPLWPYRCIYCYLKLHILSIHPS